MKQIGEGFVRKMSASLEQVQVLYQLDLSEPILLNSLLGKSIQLAFLGEMQCVNCARSIKKTFQQGYCFTCVQSLAACDLCILKPELCHYDKGTCREPEWGAAHCLQPHIIYLANTSGVKVGITREKNIPQRFIDQGATAALPVFKVMTRHASGIIEVAMAQHLADKTNWRKMLQSDNSGVDLYHEKNMIIDRLISMLNVLAQQHGVELQEANIPLIQLQYPIISYPEKVISLNFDKIPVIDGVLQGIKGQYLILSTGVVNIRNFSGYKISFSTAL